MNSKTDFVVGLVAKVSHPEAKPLAEKVMNWLAQRSIPMLVEQDTAIHLDLRGVSSERRIKREELSSRSNIIVVLGGDGTLISVCRHPSTLAPKIIGVNLGTLGFLTEIVPDELFVALENVLEGRAKLESRNLFDCSVYRDGKEHASYTALNDVVITKQALARIFALEVLINEERAAVVRGDGIILASPAGSTAYSLAAGGSIVHPQVEAMLLTPICPHSLTSRPLVLPASSRVQLRLASETVMNEIYLTVDGQVGMALTHADSVTVSTSESYIQVVTSPNKSYFEVLNAKLKWAPN